MARVHVRSSLAAHEALRVGVHRACGALGSARVVHPHAALSLVLRGSATVWCGATYELGVGDVLLIPEGMPHAMMRADELEQRGAALCTACLGEGAGRALMEVIHQVSAGACAVRHLAAGDAARLDWLLVELGRESESGHAERRAAMDALLTLMRLVLLRASASARVVDGGVEWVGLALSFIALHATEAISLSDVASHVRRAPAHVAATVRSRTGRTVSDWIVDARLAAARDWLRHSDASIEQVAASVGYGSPSQFHRVFRRVHGMTPTEWRRLHDAAAARSTW